MTYLQSALDSLYGENAVTVSIDEGNKLKFTTGEETSVFTVSSASASTVLGEKARVHVKAGETNRLELTKTLKDLASELTAPLTANENGNYEISVNGQKFEFAEDTMLGDVSPVSTIPTPA
jgi:hypothetical protein